MSPQKNLERTHCVDLDMESNFVTFFDAWVKGFRPSPIHGASDCALSRGNLPVPYAAVPYAADFLIINENIVCTQMVYPPATTGYNESSHA